MRASADDSVPPDASDREPISPRVRALEALIRASLDDLERPGGRLAASEALLFIGNWNDALPRLLIHDPVLEPVDKIVWAVIKTCTDPRRGTAFPNYATIARLANVSAEGTVTRALAILRVTRWLTLCGRARDGRGRFRGNVYALHDEPLPLVDTLHLDPAYMDFAGKAVSHGHARVGLVATGVLRSLQLDSAEGRGVELEPDPVIARIEAQQLIQHRLLESGHASRRRSAVFSRSFATRFEALPEPTPEPAGPNPSSPPPSETVPDQAQNLGTVIPRLLQKITDACRLQNLQPAETDRPQNLRPQNLRSPPAPHHSSSGGSKEKTTTTTTAGVVVENDSAADLPLYRWPNWLSMNARHLALLELRRAPAPLRQVVIDLLDQRRRDGEAAIADRLHHPIQYLRSLCRLAATGRIAQASPAPVDQPGTEQAEHERLRRQLQTAESDARHWLRLIGLTSDPKRKREWQVLADRAQAEIERCRLALKAVSDPEQPP